MADIGVGEDGGWFPTSRGSSTNSSCDGIPDLCVLVLVECNGASTTDGVVNVDKTGRVIVNSGGGAAVFALMST